jgi:hypothetical protein
MAVGSTWLKSNSTSCNDSVSPHAARWNTHHSTMHWHFTIDDARIQLHHLYPAINLLNY